MPLRVQIKIENKWYNSGLLRPGDAPGSMSDNKLGKQREVYMFECSKDDTHSTLLRSKKGIDVAIQNARAIDTEGFETVRTLRRKESHEIGIVLPSGKQISVRFTHE